MKILYKFLVRLIFVIPFGLMVIFPILFIIPPLLLLLFCIYMLGETIIEEYYNEN